MNQPATLKVNPTSILIVTQENIKSNRENQPIFLYQIQGGQLYLSLQTIQSTITNSTSLSELMENEIHWKDSEESVSVQNKQ